MSSPLRMLKLPPVVPEDRPAPTPSNSLSDGAGAGVGLCPNAQDMVKWRAEADARMEDVLARFDAAIVTGEDATSAAYQLLHGFTDWTRKSLDRFSDRPSSGVDRAAWASERAVWIGLADLAAHGAGSDPAGVDRFLRIWLGVVHEATATGQAWLYTA